MAMDTYSELEKEFAFYVANQKELVAKYDGRFLLIKGNEVVGDYATLIEALTEGESRYEPGTFLVQECGPGRENYTQTFHSQVAFA